LIDRLHQAPIFAGRINRCCIQRDVSEILLQDIQRHPCGRRRQIDPAFRFSVTQIGGPQPHGPSRFQGFELGAVEIGRLGQECIGDNTSSQRLLTCESLNWKVSSLHSMKFGGKSWRRTDPLTRRNLAAWKFGAKGIT
jgi:hypothetical protein